MNDLDVVHPHDGYPHGAYRPVGIRHDRVVADLACYALDADDADAVFRKAVDALRSTCRALRAYMFELVHDEGVWLLRCGSGWPSDSAGAMRVPINDRFINAGLKDAFLPTVFECDADDSDGGAWNALFAESGADHGLNALVRGEHGTIFGLIGMCARESQEFSASDRLLLERIAEISSKTICRFGRDAYRDLSDQRLRGFADALPQIVWTADEHGQESYFNARWDWLVNGGGDTVRRNWWDVLHPEDRAVWSSRWVECVREQTPFEIECRIYIDSLADYRWYLVRAAAAGGQAGGACWWGSGTDIHAQKLAENRLRAQARELEMVNWINTTLASELDLQKLVQKVVEVGVQLSGAQFGAYVDHNGGARDGYKLRAVAGVSAGHLDMRKGGSVAAFFDQAFHDRVVFRASDLRTDERYGRMLATVEIPVGKGLARSCLAIPVVSRGGDLLGGMVFVHEDRAVFDEDDERLIRGLATQASIAVDKATLYRELRNSKNEVRRQYKQLNAIYATAPVGLCFMDRTLAVMSVNRHLLHLVGRDGTDIRGRPLREALGAAATALEPICMRALSEREPVLNVEIGWTCPADDSKICWLCNCYPIIEPDGEVAGINTVVQDITARKKGEVELARLGSIVENSYDAIIGKTLDGVITNWNSGAERLYGYTADEAIGRHIALIVPPDREHEERNLLATLRTGNPVSLDETVRVSKHRGLIHVSATLSPITDGEGEIIGISSIARDITAKKLTEQLTSENEARMRFILDATRIGTWDWDVHTNTVRWSGNMEELHGRSPGSFDGTLENALSDVHADDLAAVQSAIAGSMAGSGDYHIEYRIITEEGRTRWLEAKGQILHDDAGRIARMAGVCMDVTDRREAEDALRISENMLRVQTEELATAHRQKDQFLAMLAHELRNPLAPISNAVQLLKIQSPEQREQTLPWAVDVIDRQVWLLSRLVDDLLDIARITRGRIELKMQQVDLKDVARIAVETAAVWFEMKNQVFEADYCPEPLPLYADPTRIIQAISNVLNNASKFTPEYGQVTMRVFLEDDYACLTVKDSGIGMPAELLPHVFDPFTQADRSLDRRKGGLGLGLSLVKRLLEMHGGLVEATSAGMGRGSEFTLRVPLAAGRAAGRHERGAQPVPHNAGDRRLRVLLVDDNRQATDAMALLLETLEHAVRVAYNGPDALRVAEAFQPEVVFLDIGLPLMDGYEVAEKLRARFGDRITLIALTGYAPQGGKNGRSEEHFDEYFLKPLSLDKLSALLLRRSGSG